MQKERYNDREQFQAKLTRALQLSDVNAGPGSTEPGATEAHIDMCWQLYQNARNNKNGKLVCGLLTDLYNAKSELGGTNEFHDGSVLNILNKAKSLGKNWSTLANDCWVLGGIHAHMPFQLVSNPTGATIKNPNYVEGITDESHIMRVTARELIGLAEFGYGGCVNPSIDSRSLALGVKYEIRCFDKSKADEATIAGYLKAVRHHTQIMKDHGAMPVREYVNDMLN